MNNKTTDRSIKSWSGQDRPREKMLAKGRQILSDAELLAILLGSGSRDESAVDLAKRILQTAGHDLHVLAKLSLGDLMAFKGIGEAKAITVSAAFELGRRRQIVDPQKRNKIKTSSDAFNQIGPILADLHVEQFWIILLSRSHEVIAKRKISEGGVSGTVVDAKVVFKIALELLASSIILVHNHPSGNLRPSRADKILTEKLVKAGNVMNINVLDHLIVGEKGYYSFADEGEI